MNLRSVLAALFILLTTAAFSQKGVVSGHVVEKLSGDDVIGGNVVIEGTAIGASTDINGKFSFPVDSGTYRLVVTYIGFQKLIVEGLKVKAGEEVKIELKLDSEDQQLQEVVITGTADRTSDSFLLVERKNAVELLQSVGAAELSVKGISNAEAAVVQVTGVTKQEGVKNVFVRGLGDRYNSSSLNGLPLPSEDPEYKNITLDFFSTDVINSIDVNKTANASLYGDMTGANVNIVSKKLFEDEIKVSFSGGVNLQTKSKDFYRADGTNVLGTSHKTIPITDLTKYSFKDSFQPQQVNSPLMNMDFAVSGGKSFLIGSNALRFFGVGALSNNYLYKQGVVRQVTPTGAPRQDFDYTKSQYDASQLLLGSLSYEFGEGSSIDYNTIFIHDNKQGVGNYTGFSSSGIDDITDPNAYKTFVRRQQQNDNSLLINQLISVLQINRKLKLDLAGSFNVAHGNEPDRRSNFYIFNGEDYVVNTSSPAFNHRFYYSLKENDISGRANATYRLSEESNNTITVGYNLRSTKRDFESTQFNFDFKSYEVVSVNDPDALFNQESLDNGLYELETGRGSDEDALNPFTYSGDRFIHAAFVNATYDLTRELTLNVGARYEAIRQEVQWDTNLDERNENIPGDNTEVRDLSYFLPSVNIKYNVTEVDIIRLASSKSYTMPQFKEVAPFYYEDVNTSSFGNPKLLPAENFNLDLRYERYFANKGLFAITTFYKHIENAINRVQVASAANELSYVNTGNAMASGVEVEFKRGLVNFNGNNPSGLDLGLNVSYLYSDQELKDVNTDDLVFQPTNKRAALEGASPLLINADLTFNREGQQGKGITAALVLNYFSDRIYSIGAPVGNNHIYERSVVKLDFISKFNLSNKLTMTLNMRNILNPAYKLTKEVVSGKDEIISEYKKGSVISVGASYKF